MARGEEMKMVYIAHPFSGKPENIENVKNIILELLKQDPQTVYYSPLHATGFYYFAISYAEGMKHCFEALKRCDELWLCEGWEESKGCNMEVHFAQQNGIPIRLVANNDKNMFLEGVNG